LSFHGENRDGLSLANIASFGAEVPIMAYKKDTAKTSVVFPDQQHKGERIYKIRYDPSEKSKIRPYQLQFYAKYRSRVDPQGLVKALASRKTYASIDDCHASAKDIIDRLVQDGASITSIDSYQRTRLLNLTLQLRQEGIDAEQLLYDSITMKKMGLDPIKALQTGKTLVTKAKNYDGKTLGDYIALYKKDPLKKKLATFQNIITTLQGLDHLSEIKIETLISKEKTIEALTKVYQTYTSKPTITKRSSLDAQRRRVSQLLQYTNQKTNLPTQEVKDSVCSIDSYQEVDLYEGLEDGNPIVSFSAIQVLVLLKFFSRDETFDPIWIITSILMGQRQATIPELKWKNICPNPDNDDKSWDIRIPKELTKLGRQKRLTQDLVFSVDSIPNLRQWLNWGRSLYKEAPKPEETIPAIKKHYLRWQLMNNCITDFQDLFNFNEDILKKGASFSWGNLCKNGMRNTYFTMGLEHPEVSKYCCKIGNDYKSIDKYQDTERTDADKQAKLLFSIIPAHLSLVDLDKGVVYKEFLEATKEERQAILYGTKEGSERDAYEAVMLAEYGLFPEDLMAYGVDDPVDNLEVWDNPLEQDREGWD